MPARKKKRTEVKRRVEKVFKEKNELCFITLFLNSWFCSFLEALLSTSTHLDFGIYKWGFH